MESEIPIIQSKKTSKVKKNKLREEKKTHQDFNEELSHGILAKYKIPLLLLKILVF